MKLKKKKFKNFLLSNNANFISYAISKIHLTYFDNNKNENFNPILSLIKKFFYLFDNKNLYTKKQKHTDILIISNLVSIKKKEEDIYFGNLNNLLKREKFNTLSVYRNLTSVRSKLLKNTKKNKILLSKRLSYFKEILIFYFFLKESFLLIFSTKYSLIRKHLNTMDLLSIIPNLRLNFQLEELLKFYKPKFVIFTYEGHAWERLLIYLCSKNEYKIKSIAYQFSAIKKSQIGFFNELKKGYNPDYIASTGKISQKIIENKIKFSKIIKLGSPKYLKINRKYYKNVDVLVALDTDKEDLFKVLNFCKDFALKNSKYKIILRLHPIMSSNEKLITKIKKVIKNIPNIKLSNISLMDDLKKAKYLLFTESTICLTGLNYNVVPLFFNIKNTNNIFDRNFPKENIIKNSSELKNLFEKKINKNLSHYFRNYRDNYFEKYDVASLKKIMKNNEK